MAIIDATNLTTVYNPLDSFSAAFSTYQSHTSTTYTFETVDGHIITLIGTGITVNGSNIPVTGTITSVTIDVDGDSPATPDVQITDTSFDVTELLYGSTSLASATFWVVMTRGETTILEGNFEFDIAGDSFTGISGFHIGYTDQFVGMGADNSDVYGDFRSVSGTSTAIGGDDVFTGAFDTIYGDTGSLSSDARLIAGADQITLTMDFTADADVTIYGDASNLSTRSVLFAGDDIIDVRALVSARAVIYADANIAYGTSFVVGGNDTIYGTGLNDVIYADIRGLSASSQSDQPLLEGGTDSVWGGDGDDVIYGDYASISSSGPVRGGDDMLFGEAGNDIIYGNEGMDTIDGGAGDDHLDGGAQADTIIGGTGNDVIVGGSGTDWIDGGKGEDIITGGDGNDYILGGNVGDTLSGGNQNDTIQGQSGNDIINGNSGDDVLIGQIGNDTITGGSGNDVLNAGGGDDVLTGGVGADIFTFTNSTGANQINDFEDGTDMIHFTSNNLQFGDLTLQQSGADVLITAGAQTILVLNMDVADLDVSDFMFGS